MAWLKEGLRYCRVSDKLIGLLTNGGLSDALKGYTSFITKNDFYPET